MSSKTIKIAGKLSSTQIWTLLAIHSSLSLAYFTSKCALYVKKCQRCSECNSALLGPLSIKKVGRKFADLDSYMRNQLLSSINANSAKDKPFFLIGGSWRAIAKIHMQRTKYPLKIIQGYKVESKKLKRTLEFIQDSSFLNKYEEMNISLENRC